MGPAPAALAPNSFSVLAQCETRDHQADDQHEAAAAAGLSAAVQAAGRAVVVAVVAHLSSRTGSSSCSTSTSLPLIRPAGRSFLRFLVARAFAELRAIRVMCARMA